MRDTKYANAIVSFHDLGYYVTRDGDLINPKGKKLKGTVNNAGYRMSGNILNGKHQKFFVHQMQAYQKFGKKALQKGMQVRHLNGNCLDNSWNNIELGTAADNASDIPQHVRKRRAQLGGQKGGRVSGKLPAKHRKLSYDDAENIRSQYRYNNTSYKSLAKKFGVSRTVVEKIIKRETYRS